MRTLCSLLVALVLVFPLTGQAESLPVENDNPYELLEEVAERMIKRIGEERSKIEEEPQYLRQIMEEELLPYSDYQFAARQVMGRNWQRLDEEQQQEFVEVFREYLVTTYARVFTQYDEERHELEFGSRGRWENERRVTVRARLIEEGGRPPIRLEFHMQRRRPDAPWQAFDLVAENVSMLNTQQAEMQASLRQRGFDGTIELLRERANVEIDLDEELDMDDFEGEFNQ